MRREHTFCNTGLAAFYCWLHWNALYWRNLSETLPHLLPCTKEICSCRVFVHWWLREGKTKLVSWFWFSFTITNFNRSQYLGSEGARNTSAWMSCVNSSICSPDLAVANSHKLWFRWLFLLPPLLLLLLFLQVVLEAEYSSIFIAPDDPFQATLRYSTLNLVLLSYFPCSYTNGLWVAVILPLSEGILLEAWLCFKWPKSQLIYVFLYILIQNLFSPFSM